MIGRRKEVMKVIQQLFVERGFLETSVQDILQAANISKGTFYNYFSSKNDCLIAILKQAQKEAFLRRKQLLLDGKEDDREVFAKQILIRLHLNKEQNLLPLLGSLFHSKDEELREFAKQYHLQELTWLTGRFIQIYGRNIKPVAIDCAVSLQGLLQQYSLVWSYYSKKEVHAKELIRFVLRRVDTIVKQLIEVRESFIDQELYYTVYNALEKFTRSKKQLTDALLSFQDQYIQNNDEAEEFIQFFIQEINRAKPRIFLFETNLKSFYHYFAGGKKEVAARDLVEKLFQYTTTLKEKYEQT